MYNLLENALRHGGETLTLIRVFAQERPDRSLLLVFEDNGIGIPPEDKELIFTQGYGKNTGLGLALSREILAMTDISIAETGLPGAGARFELCIPPQSWKKS